MSTVAEDFAEGLLGLFPNEELSVDGDSITLTVSQNFILNAPGELMVKIQILAMEVGGEILVAETHHLPMTGAVKFIFYCKPEGTQEG